MGAFFRELLRTRIYKRSQGRITRQVTFAAVALAIALGLWRLSAELRQYDPIIHAQPAEVVCTPEMDRLAADGTIRVTGAGAADIPVHQGDNLTDIVKAINNHQDATGVVANLPEDEDGEKRKLAIASKNQGAEATLQVELPQGAFTVAGIGADGVARGRDALNLGLRFLVPGVLLFVFLWATYRVVNLPTFADFLIAVEAEMNKVSWPSRHELFRASTVVLIFIFALAIILAIFDFSWSLLFRQVLHIM